MFVQILGKKIKKPSANFEAFCYSLYSGAPNDGFLPMHWKHFLRLYRVRLDL